MTTKKDAFGKPIKRRLEEARRQEEVFALEIFLSAFGRAHSSPRRGVPGKEPDFLLEVDSERIGLELTELVSDKLRKQEEFRVDVVVEAREAYAGQNGPPLEVHVQWHDFEVRGNRKKIAEAIVELINSMAPANLPVHVRQEVPEERFEAAGLPFIASISVLRKMEGRTNTWTVPVAGTVLEVDSHRLESVISSKEEALRSFLHAPAHLPWLLIYSFDNRVSGSSELAEDARQAKYRTKFERVFVLDAPRKEIAELNVTSPPKTGT